MKATSLQHCSKCGLCLNVCPVYKIIKEESASPRARLQQILAHDKKELASTPLLKELVSKCLMCGTCTVNCPSGVQHYSKFMEMRKKMAADHGDMPAIRSMIYCLARDNRIKLSAGLAQKGQQLLPKFLSSSFKIGNIPASRFPRLNLKPYRSAHNGEFLPEKKSIGTVTYFTGCATNYLFDDTGTAVVSVLNHMGYKVIIPKEQTCCSIPLLFHGARDQAQKNIEINITAMSACDADAIVVDCSTCGEALKNVYPSFFMDKEDNKALKMSSKVVDILSFVDQHFDQLDLVEKSKQVFKTTYHAPCHTRNSFGSHLAAENILKRLPNIEYDQTPDFDECCGGGGTFFYEHPEIAKQIITKKVSNANALSVKTWATDCPVCRINLAGNIEPAGSMEVVHPLTLVSRALACNL